MVKVITTSNFMVSCRVLLLLFWLLINQQVNGQSDEHSVILQVVNIKSKTGNLVVRLYDKVDNFNQKNNQFVKEKIVAINAYSPRTIFVKFDDLQVGKYAAYIFVDNNKNDIVDLDRFGEPTEQFTFSRREGYNLKKWSINQSFKDVYFEYLGAEIRMMVKVEK